MIHQALHNQSRSDIGKAPCTDRSYLVQPIGQLRPNQLVEGLMRIRKRHIVTDTIGIPLAQCLIIKSQ